MKNTKQVARLIQDRVGNNERYMPHEYTQAPSFFNNVEASQKAKSIVSDFTQSYLGQYSDKPLGGVNDIVEDDFQRTNLNKKLKERTRDTNMKLSEQTRARKANELTLTQQLERQLLQNDRNEEYLKSLLKTKDKRLKFLQTKKAMAQQRATSKPNRFA